jgi:hypothetical protein
MKKYWLLIVSLIIGTQLRLISLGGIPQGLTWDEAALGYNAYSILKTGRDEFGKFLPIIFKSFGDYKPGLYVYAAVPTVAVFGLNEFATRLPSAIFGVIAIFGIFLLVKIITEKSDESVHKYLPSLSAFALAVSPWHVHFSRGAWEVNVFCTLLLLSLYFLIKFIKSQSTLFPAIILACLSLLTYQAAKLLTPLMFILVIAIYWKSFWKNFLVFGQKKSNYFLIPFVLLGFWVYFGIFFSSAGNRLGTLSIFTYKPAIEEKSIFHTQSQLTASLIARRYLYYFSPEVLFFEGSITTDRGHIPRSGMFNYFEFIWIILGVIFVSRNTKEKWVKLVLGVLLVSPIAASLTLAEFSTLRSLFIVFPYAIISACGMYFVIKNNKLLFGLILGVYLFFTYYIFELYFMHGKYVFPKEFIYGYKQAMQYAIESPNSKMIFTDVLGQPYIYYLFYSGYSPSEYQKTDHFVDMGLDVGKVEKVGKAEFHQFTFGDILTGKDTIFVGMEGNLPNGVDITNPVVEYYKSIKYPDGNEIFRIIKTKP